MNTRIVSLVFFVSLIVIGFSAVSHAQVVTSLSNGGAGSLRDVIAGAAPGSTVTFDPSLNGGTITLSSEIIINKNLTITGPGADLLTVSGGNSTRIFNITAPGINFSVSDLTIANGFVQDDDGGMLIINDESITLNFQRCVFESNRVQCVGGGNCSGGVISSFSQFLSLEIGDSYFISNGASCSGNCGVSGGVMVIGGGSSTIKIINTVFDSNSVSCIGSSCDVSGSILDAGGGSATITVMDSTFESNSASCSGDGCESEGGALDTAGGSIIAEVVGSTFYSNTVSCNGEDCEARGGALVNPSSSADWRFTNTTFASNSVSCAGPGCTSGGGVIFNIGLVTTIDLYFSTLSMNSSTCTGAGCTAEGANIGNIEESTDIRANSTIFNNESFSGNCAPGAITSLGYNIDNGNSCIDGSGPGDKPNTDPRLDPRGTQDNGGPTETIALLSSSPAIDMADPACPPPDTDQRGISRPEGSSCDIGAYELLLARPIPTLSEWGLIVMAVVLGIMGLIAIKRKSLLIRS